MDSPSPVHFFFLLLLVFVGPIALAFPAANGFLTYTGLSATPGHWPHSAAVATCAMILTAALLKPPPLGASSLLIVLLTALVPGAALSWLWYPNAPWFTSAPPPLPKGGEGAGDASPHLYDASPHFDTDEEEEDPAGSTAGSDKIYRQRKEIANLQSHIAKAKTFRERAEAKDRAKYDRTIAQYETRIKELELQLQAHQPSITAKGAKALDVLQAYSDNMKVLALGFSGNMTKLALGAMGASSDGGGGGTRPLPPPRLPQFIVTDDSAAAGFPASDAGARPSTRTSAAADTTKLLVNTGAPWRAPSAGRAKGGGAPAKNSSSTVAAPTAGGGGGSSGGGGGGGGGKERTRSDGKGGTRGAQPTWTCGSCTFENPTTRAMCEMCAGRPFLEPLTWPKSEPCVKKGPLNAQQAKAYAALQSQKVNGERGDVRVLDPDGSKHLCLLHATNAALGLAMSDTNALALAKGLLNVANATIAMFPKGKESGFSGICEKITNCPVSVQCIRDEREALLKVLAGKSTGLGHPATLLLTCILFANIPLVLTCAAPCGGGDEASADNVHYFVTTRVKPWAVPPIIGALFFSGKASGHYYVYFMKDGRLKAKGIDHASNVPDRIRSCLAPTVTAGRLEIVAGEESISNLNDFYAKTRTKDYTPVSLHCSSSSPQSAQTRSGAATPTGAQRPLTTITTALEEAGAPPQGMAHAEPNSESAGAPPQGEAPAEPDLAAVAKPPHPAAEGPGQATPGETAAPAEPAAAPARGLNMQRSASPAPAPRPPQRPASARRAAAAAAAAANTTNNIVPKPPSGAPPPTVSQLPARALSAPGASNPKNV